MSSLPSFSTARLITCQVTPTGRTCSTSSIQRDVIHAHGHSGSNQKSTGVGSCSAMGLLLVVAGPDQCWPVDQVSGAASRACPAAPPSACNRHAPDRIPPPAVGKCLSGRPDELRTAENVDTTHRGHGKGARHVANNLTREEARDRRQLL